MLEIEAAEPSVPAISRSRKTLSDAFGAGAYHISSMLVTLAVTPILLWGIGLEGYGFWALISAASKYGGAADFGIGPSITRNVAAYNAQGDRYSVQQTITFGTLFYLMLIAIGLPAGIVLAPILVGLGHLHDERIRSQAPLLLTAYIANYLVSLLAGCYSSALAGLGRVQTTSRIGAISRIVFAGVAAASMFLHMGLLGVTYALSIQGLIILGVTYATIRRVYGPVLINPRRLQKSLVKRVVSNGGWIQISSLMVLIYAETDQLVVAAVLGLSASALFDVGSRLARAVRALSFYFNSAFLPAVASFDAERGSARMLAVFADGTRYLGVVTFFTSGMLFVGAGAFIPLWIGPGPHNATIVWIVQILVFVYIIDNMLAVAITMLRGMGTPKTETAYSVVNAVVNIILTIALVKPFGMAGILFGTLGGTLVGAVVFMVVFSRTRSVDLRDLLGPPMLRLSATFVATLAVVSAFDRLCFVGLRTTRTGAAVELVAVLVLYTFVFAGGLRLARALSPYDRAFLKQALPSAFTRFFDSPFIRGLFARTA